MVRQHPWHRRDHGEGLTGRHTLKAITYLVLGAATFARRRLLLFSSDVADPHRTARRGSPIRDGEPPPQEHP